MIAAHSTDSSVLRELGERLKRTRIRRELTQRELGREAGVSVDTVKRAESGRPIGTDNLVRLLRTLGLLAALDQAIPAPRPSPVERRALEGADRQRVRHARNRGVDDERTWTWGDEPGRDR